MQSDFFGDLPCTRGSSGNLI